LETVAEWGDAFLLQVEAENSTKERSETPLSEKNYEMDECRQDKKKEGYGAPAY